MAKKTNTQRERDVIDEARRLVKALDNDRNHLGKTLALYIAETTCSCPCDACPADAFQNALWALEDALWAIDIVKEVHERQAIDG
jgi:hypothetical protein